MRALRALLLMAAGHAAAMVPVMATVMWGLQLDRAATLAAAGGLLAIAVALRLCRRTPQAARAPAGLAGLAISSFMMATAHGAGLALVPALAPLCIGSL